MTPSQLDGTPQLRGRPVRRGLVLTICCLSVCITGIDITIVNVALPSIARSLHASVSSLQWTIDAYTLVIACLLVLSGSLADRLGRKRIFQIGLSLFALSSLLCGLAPGVGWLIAFRALQAVGGSMLNPVALALIVSVYTEQKDRARAIGVWGVTVGLTVAAGPVLGGILVSAIDWRSVFWVNVPIAAAAIVLAQRYVPESRADRVRAVDPPGQALIILLFGSIIFATIEGPHHGWGSPLIIALYAVACAALAVLIAVESHRPEPLIDLRFFRSPPFSGANVIALAISASLGGFLFLNTLYLQDVRHYSALRAGLMIIPLAVGQGVSAQISGRLVGSKGPRIPLLIGGGLLALGGFLLVPLTVHTSIVYLLVTYGVFGLGAGMVAPPVSNTAVSGLPRDQAGVASALASSARQFGIAIGVAVTGSIVAGATTGFVQASHVAWIVLGCCGLTAFALGLMSTSTWALDAAKRNGERLTTATTTRQPQPTH